MKNVCNHRNGIRIFFAILSFWKFSIVSYLYGHICFKNVHSTFSYRIQRVRNKQDLWLLNDLFYFLRKIMFLLFAFHFFFFFCLIFYEWRWFPMFNLCFSKGKKKRVFFASLKKFLFLVNGRWFRNFPKTDKMFIYLEKFHISSKNVLHPVTLLNIVT